jgi:hypothetical protein
VASGRGSVIEGLCYRASVGTVTECRQCRVRPRRDNSAATTVRTAHETDSCWGCVLASLRVDFGETYAVAPPASLTPSFATATLNEAQNSSPSDSTEMPTMPLIETAGWRIPKENHDRMLELARVGVDGDGGLDYQRKHPEKLFYRKTRRGGLCGDGRVASTGVGHSHAEAQAAESVAGGDVPEHGPRLHVGVKRW